MYLLFSSTFLLKQWWAFEHRNQDIVKLLMKHGVSHTDQDKFGKTPVILLDSA